MLEVICAWDFGVADVEADGWSPAPTTSFGEEPEQAATPDMRRTAAVTAAQVRRDRMELLWIFVKTGTVPA
jgi:hypothetical protein